MANRIEGITAGPCKTRLLTGLHGSYALRRFGHDSAETCSMIVGDVLVRANLRYKCKLLLTSDGRVRRTQAMS